MALEARSEVLSSSASPRLVSTAPAAIMAINSDTLADIETGETEYRHLDQMLQQSRGCNSRDRDTKRQQRSTAVGAELDHAGHGF